MWCEKFLFFEFWKLKMATELASGGYRIAKSWQYQESLPDPIPSTVSSAPHLNDFTNNNSFYVSSSLNRNPVCRITKDEEKKGRTFLARFFKLPDTEGPSKGDEEEPCLRRHLLPQGAQAKRYLNIMDFFVILTQTKCDFFQVLQHIHSSFTSIPAAS